MDEIVFDTLDQAWNDAIKHHLKGEQINVVEIHWGHGILIIRQKAMGDRGYPYKVWELVDDP